VTGVMVSLLIISGLGIVNGMDTRLLAKISVLILGVLVSIGFVVYTICWMYFDRRMG
jgi:phage shock protein PspC (stress-responsive transcriptional regulator)